MQKFKVDKKKAEAVAKNIFYLAWKESGVFGMGILQDRPESSKEDVWSNVCDRGDYPIGRTGEENDYYADYVFGRMMKLMVKLNKKKGVIEMQDSDPRPDYQSWCRKYPSYEALFNAAIEETEKEVHQWLEGKRGWRGTWP